jgi:hypothetical protein
MATAWFQKKRSWFFFPKEDLPADWGATAGWFPCFLGCPPLPACRLPEKIRQKSENLKPPPCIFLGELAVGGGGYETTGRFGK